MTGSIGTYASAVSSPAPDDSDLGLINDNSKRIVSLRINTSDYGRIKAIARRFKVRDSDALRFILKTGLNEMATLCRSDAGPVELLRVFAAHGPALVRHFDLSPRRIAQILRDEPRDDVQIAAEDIELIADSVQPDRFLALRLQELTGEAIAPADARAALRGYLENKYARPAVPGSADDTE